MSNDTLVSREPCSCGGARGRGRGARRRTGGAEAPAGREGALDASPDAVGRSRHRRHLHQQRRAGRPVRASRGVRRPPARHRRGVRRAGRAGRSGNWKPTTPNSTLQRPTRPMPARSAPPRRRRRIGSIAASQAAAPRASSIRPMAGFPPRRRKGRSASPIGPRSAPGRAVDGGRPIRTWTAASTTAALRAVCLVR